MIQSSKAIIVFNKKMLLMLRDNNPAIPGPNTWSLVGGGLEEGESFDQAMEREMKEEIGIVPKSINYLGKIGFGENIYAVYFIKITKDELNRVKLGNEGQKIEFFDFEEVKNLNLAGNVRRYIDAYGDYLRQIVENDTEIDPNKLGLTK